MNYKEFYINAERRIEDAILSLWATGDIETQKYLKYIFENEQLFAEPVFQTTFPWESSQNNFGNSSLFNREFINALDNIKDDEYRFPVDRYPYKHQEISWKTLLSEEKNSIIVTTGTGSGKTECFMLPVLYDIYKNSHNSRGVNAIFLYPLNALIGSQKKRIDAWTKAIGGINYGIYNGNTLESCNSTVQKKAYPEILSRELIRKEPPQILFTNPTMLEYILVRNKDVGLLNNSKGKLKWILLDEAHTLTGSKAAEMAMLIKRVLDAFEVEVNSVQFAATSATVGSDSDSDLLQFMSKLSGLPGNKIRVINGSRYIPELKEGTIEKCTLTDLQNSRNISEYKLVHDLRPRIVKCNALKLSEIAKPFEINSVNEGLTLIDMLSDSVINGNQVFPTRGHFFVRSIGGVFVCTNSNCDKHGINKPDKAIGTMTTFAAKQCTSCGYPLMELVACRSCGNYLLFGEKFLEIQSMDDYVRLHSSVTQDAFYIENEEVDEDFEDVPQPKQLLYLAKYFKNKRYIDEKYLNPIHISSNGKIQFEESFVWAERSGKCLCPHCGESMINPIHFRISSSFLNRVLSDIILEQTPESKQITPLTLWKGHKYISFTDSRQGTAKVSALINIDNETNWIRSQVFHLLCQRRKESAVNINRDQILAAIAQYEQELRSCIDFLKPKKEKELNELKNLLRTSGTPLAHNSRMGWKELQNKLIVKNELKTLLFNSKKYDDVSEEIYLRSLFFDQFAKRMPRERSLENLGLVNVVYPDLEDVKLPSIIENLGINLDEWKKLLKICVDYFLRSYYHFFLPPDIRNFCTSYLKSIKIYPNRSSLENVDKWPKFDGKKLRQNRLSLLLCAGIGIHSLEQITPVIEDNINAILDELWKVLKNRLLTRDGVSDEDGYKINIEEKFSFELADQLWLCPVKNRMIDTHFKEYSPWITGNLTQENILHYKVGESFTFPYYPFPFNMNAEGDYDIKETINWINKISPNLKERGVWNNLHERIIQLKPLFLAGEHSAQQTSSRLQTLEKYFESGRINILNCSTTMEMGVDIGGVSVVVLNNVPPSPINYLQRAGRAGRRLENKSLVLTICAANPMGSNSMNNPMWALAHKIAPPSLYFNSPALIERHFNAFFLGKFLQTLGGLNIKENIDGFFFGVENQLSTNFDRWLTAKIKMTDYENSIKYLKLNTPLVNKNSLWVISMVIGNFLQILNKTEYKLKDFKEALERLKVEFGENSPAYKSVNYQKNQFLNKNVFSYLVEKGFLPNSGMPTGVVSMDITTINDLKKGQRVKENPSYHIIRALTEYAPGHSIVIDGWNYVSDGILLKSEWSETQKDIIQSCTSCGFQRIVEINEQNEITTKCPHCQKDNLKGILFTDGTQFNFTEVIEPSGFATDLFRPATRKISETSNVQYIEPLLIGIQPWKNESYTIYDIRESVKGAEILYYNMGNGNGYSLCLHCGKTAYERAYLRDHKRLRGGKDEKNESICSGNLTGHGIKDRVILGGRFKTDFCEIRFRSGNLQFDNDETTLWSLGIILTKTFASFLGVEENELSFGIKRYDTYRSMFIFDTSRGGAGYSVKFSLYAEEIFKEALSKLKGCSCEKACTKCLIDRSSQRYIQKLNRNNAIEWLERSVKQTVPEDLKASIPNLQSVFGSIKEDIRRVKYRNEIEQVWFFIDNNVSEWDLSNSIFLSDFRNLNNKINFVVSANLLYGNDEQNTLTAIQMQSWANFYLDKGSYGKLMPVCQIRLTNGEHLVYFSEQFKNGLNENWGESDKGYLSKTNKRNYFQLDLINISLHRNNLYEIYLSDSYNIKSNQLGEVFLKEVGKNVNIIDLMKNQEFDILYSDRYLKSAFSCLLLVQFIAALREVCNFQIKSLTIRGKKFMEINSPRMLYDNCLNSEEKNNHLKRFLETNKISSVNLENDNLPHYRFLILKNKERKITIRPDGGIEHGWYCGRNERYAKLSGSEEISIKKGVEYPILYSIVIE